MRNSPFQHEIESFKYEWKQLHDAAMASDKPEDLIDYSTFIYQKAFQAGRLSMARDASRILEDAIEAQAK